MHTLSITCFKFRSTTTLNKLILSKKKYHSIMEFYVIIYIENYLKIVVDVFDKKRLQSIE
jgi:hypothetical protein